MNHSSQLGVPHANKVLISGGFGVWLDSQGRRRAIENSAASDSELAREISLAPQSAQTLAIPGHRRGCLVGFLHKTRITFGLRAQLGKGRYGLH